MKRSDKEHVRLRAANRCEYCRLHQDHAHVRHHVDHIRAKKHRGAKTVGNCCLACAECNRAKGSNVAGIDVESGALSRLFDPRKDDWDEHFAWQGAVLLGLTPVGRVTVDVLCINDDERVQLRTFLVAAGVEF